MPLDQKVGKVGKVEVIHLLQDHEVGEVGVIHLLQCALEDCLDYPRLREHASYPLRVMDQTYRPVSLPHSITNNLFATT